MSRWRCLMKRNAGGLSRGEIHGALCPGAPEKAFRRRANQKVLPRRLSPRIFPLVAVVDCRSVILSGSEDMPPKRVAICLSHLTGLRGPWASVGFA